MIKEEMKNMPVTMNGVKLSALAVNYAYLVEEGYYKFDDVPKSKKSDCAVALVLWGDEKLVTDSTYLQEAKQRIEQAKQVQE